MHYEVEVNGRVRQVGVHRVAGRFVVTVDGQDRSVDAVRVDGFTLSLLIEEGGGDRNREAPGPTIGSSPTSSHEVTLAPDPVSGRSHIRVGGTDTTVSLNDRRRWGRRNDGQGGASWGASHGDERIVAPMPGKIARVLLKKGDTVHARQPVVVIEAMKMENELRAAADGTLTEIHVQDGQSVDAGALLAVIHR